MKSTFLLSLFDISTLKRVRTSLFKGEDILCASNHSGSTIVLGTSAGIVNIIPNALNPRDEPKSIEIANTDEGVTTISSFGEHHLLAGDEAGRLTLIHLQNETWTPTISKVSTAIGRPIVRLLVCKDQNTSYVGDADGRIHRLDNTLSVLSIVNLPNSIETLPKSRVFQKFFARSGVTDFVILRWRLSNNTKSIENVVAGSQSSLDELHMASSARNWEASKFLSDVNIGHIVNIRSSKMLLAFPDGTHTSLLLILSNVTMSNTASLEAYAISLIGY
jgi:hypothetical protein